ncbi:tRNA (adenosine(37)-N6)-dimethylallyltransferase MiaA [Tissierella sp. MSJ-40]|uniref:tRNA dimethylallyltransferase n=1 Tax=Tissierella simiarum TaxID=2841534 RepID=A0ABS6E401_9FIRM|nr:tRNA (adenosine(37)-N6)-dimethylallyltransferase MiaA [Tissierella simiarum]MBU5437626.1 tRNA (adenosine(37)-N6)-dimethylallyltransferase MiaA [Tissierella simiarum]
MDKKENLFILIGPTAIGKTSLSIDLAKNLNGEIISADSMQIYKYMDIGTAKVTKEEMESIPHYLIDIVYPNEDFTVSDYKKAATKHITEVNNREKLPLVVGGTGLYINSLVYQLNFTQVCPNEEFRKKYEDLADKYGNQYIYDELKKIDLYSSQKISPKDRKRIIRALEIYYETGKTMSEYNKDFRKPVENYNLSMIGLNMDRTLLYNRINQRVDLMIEKGLIDEIKMLLEMGYTKDLVSMQGIGYKEIVYYLQGDISLDKAIELIKKGSRNYAKRQLTWFRRDNRIKWIDVDTFHHIKDISQYITNYVKESISLNN